MLGDIYNIASRSIFYSYKCDAADVETESAKAPSQRNMLGLKIKPKQFMDIEIFVGIRFLSIVYKR